MLPVILGIGAAVAGATGVGTGIHGAVKMKGANDTMKDAQSRHENNVARFQAQTNQTTQTMDALGTKEMQVLASFRRFSDLFEKIQNRPQFKALDLKGVKLPGYDKEELSKASIGAGILLGGLGGAALGTAGGFAAAGATTSAVMALGTASTGTAIASLSGAAATNATLAAIGGGALAAGGGGIALGTTILGATTLGVGILVGGVIFNITGGSLSKKADEAWAQMLKAEGEINRSCDYLSMLNQQATRFLTKLEEADSVYRVHLRKLAHIVEDQQRTDFNFYTPEEQLVVENTVLLVAVLYDMCKVKMVIKKDNEANHVNHTAIDESLLKADQVLDAVPVDELQRELLSANADYQDMDFDDLFSKLYAICYELDVSKVPADSVIRINIEGRITGSLFFDIQDQRLIVAKSTERAQHAKITIPTEVLLAIMEGIQTPTDAKKREKFTVTGGNSINYGKAMTLLWLLYYKTPPETAKKQTTDRHDAPTEPTRSGCWTEMQTVNRRDIMEKTIRSSYSAVKKSSSVEFRSGDELKTNQKKLDKIMKFFKHTFPAGSIIAMYDTSLGANGRDGIIFTEEGFAFDYAFSPTYIKYDDIKTLKIVKKDLHIWYRDKEVSIANIFYNLPELKRLIEALSDLVRCAS